jgi:hypothetical protein
MAGHGERHRALDALWEPAQARHPEIDLRHIAEGDGGAIVAKYGYKLVECGADYVVRFLFVELPQDLERYV